MTADWRPQPVVPLDPDSERGRFVADALERELAEQLLEEMAAARGDVPPPMPVQPRRSRRRAPG